MITSVLRFCKLHEITNTYLHIIYLDTFEIEGRSFPADIIIKWSDLKMKREIGQGNFGKVYQGYVDISQVQR